jgi:glycosyltransferase involved in cell wall biosynthesis
MRVLMVSWEYAPHIVGGLGKHVMELAPALVAKGVEVHVLTPLLAGGAPREVTAEGVHVHRFETPFMEGYSFITFNQEVNDLLERAGRALGSEVGGFDLIHVHDWLTASAGAGLKHTWRIPLISTIHATERGRGQGALVSEQAERINTIEWWLTYESWRVIACSQFMAVQVNEYFRTPIDKIDVVPNGVRIKPSPFVSEAERWAYRRSLAEDDQPIAYYVGRIVYEKGLHVLLDAWTQVLRVYPRARLLIAGAGTMLESLKAQADRLGMHASVVFAGFISDEERDRLYHIADVAVFPSLYEPFGMVALEAMAAYCPVVVSATGGLIEVVRQHDTGITIEPNNADSLAWGILHTLQKPEWSKKRAENAYNEAYKCYSWERIAIETIDVYQHARDEWDKGSWGKELSPRPS